MTTTRINNNALTTDHLQLGADLYSNCDTTDLVPVNILLSAQFPLVHSLTIHFIYQLWSRLSIFNLAQVETSVTGTILVGGQCFATIKTPESRASVAEPVP
jgi:hypothetical protein